MIQLDDKFLANVGLADLPVAERPALLQVIYSEIELRVGTALSNGLSDEQLEEFEGIIDRDPSRVMVWIETHATDFENDPIYQKMRGLMEGNATPSQIVCEYAATKWLEINRSDYKDVVAAVVNKIAQEIRCQAAQILAGRIAGVSAAD